MSTNIARVIECSCVVMRVHNQETYNRVAVFGGVLICSPSQCALISTN
jgi:F0F1-type ATP synthase epsilon subunit